MWYIESIVSMDRDKQKRLLVAVVVVVIGGMALYEYLSYEKLLLTDTEQKSIIFTEEEYQKYLEDVKM